MSGRGSVTLASRPRPHCLLAPYPQRVRVRACAAVGGAGGLSPVAKSAGEASVGEETAEGKMTDWELHAAPGDPSPTHIPLVRGSPEGGKNCYADISASNFSLRGKTYLDDGVKLPSVEAAFRLVGAHAFLSTRPMHRAGDVLPELRDYLASHPTRHFLIVAWLLPGCPTHTVMQVFVRNTEPDPVLDPLYQVLHVSPSSAPFLTLALLTPSDYPSPSFPCLFGAVFDVNSRPLWVEVCV